MSEDTESGLITKKQRSFLGVVTVLISIIVGLQSYGILPYQMTDVRVRLADIEKSRREDHDITVGLKSELTAARGEIAGLREEIRQFRTDFFNKR